MEIKILGTGCAKCRAMFQLTEQAVNELRLEASVVKEEDILKIISYKVLGLPALVVDGEVVSAGHDLTKEEIKVLIAK
ncbi:thioredoxin family protein [Odoribacter sp. AF15-53]|uniref:thioredoxin family protein n=1 Tax=Odoribacter sp. AF15-53 TaxID=2292236 RepID=UPI000E529EA8|nr:thioredoxin family protein [Odoribacter sp. AF15-53]RHR78942.1 thioredoxin family protein [Odoribacter sp. AF15-53]